MAADEVPAWTVVQQTETSDVGPTGGYVAGVRVTFLTRGGVTSSVFVVQADYTPAKVRAIIDQKAAAADAIQALQG